MLRYLLISLSFFFLGTACSSEADSSADREDRTAATDESASTVDFRDLKARLPETLVGLERTDVEGQKTRVAGVSVAMAEAIYQRDRQRLDISIIDGAGSLLSGVAGWLDTEYDRESDKGYERTTTIDGMPAYEKYNHHKRTGTLAVLAQDRYVVTIEARDIDADELRDVLDALKLRKLRK